MAMNISPAGRAVVSAQCPHAPVTLCTATRAVGVGTLYRDTIYAAAVRLCRIMDSQLSNH